MSSSIPVRRIPFDNNYILGFVVKDHNTVNVQLMTDKDPTMINTEFITVASRNINREASLDGCDMEDFDTFSERMYGEARAWAKEAIQENEATIALAKSVANVLPPGIEV